MSNFIFNFLVAFFVLIGFIAVYIFVTATFETIYLNLGAAVDAYKAPLIMAFVFSLLFASAKSL